MKIRLIPVALIACVGIMLLAPGTAAADSVTIKIKPIAEGVANYSGKVKSARARCEKGRKVTIFHDSIPPFKIGETTTDENGDYSLDGISPPSGDDVIVVVSKKGTGKRKCRRLEAAATVP